MPEELYGLPYRHRVSAQVETTNTERTEAVVEHQIASDPESAERCGNNIGGSPPREATIEGPIWYMDNPVSKRTNI